MKLKDPKSRTVRLTIKFNVIVTVPHDATHEDIEFRYNDFGLCWDQVVWDLEEAIAARHTSCACSADPIATMIREATDLDHMYLPWLDRGEDEIDVS